MSRLLLATMALALCPTLHAGTLADDLKLLAGERIYFGHQSVGKNVLDGVQELIAIRNAVGRNGRNSLAGSHWLVKSA